MNHPASRDRSPLSVTRQSNMVHGPWSIVILSLFLAITAILPSRSYAQTKLIPDRFAFSPEITYDTGIVAPKDFLGYELGMDVTLYADVVAYMKSLAESSDRVTIFPYGQTYERRPLYYLVITSPANQTRIEEIRQNNLRLADPATLSEAEADSLVASQPVIVWLSYNIHGNEPPSTEAAMQLAYRLAAGLDEESLSLLDNLVIIIDPCLNPDGRDRYAYWYRSMRSDVLNTSADDIEHSEPWPGGRTNHYWFDLNRDWVWLVHPESQGRIAAYQQWLPQVHVDNHEMGYNTNYFTMPGTTPRNLNLPDEYDTWADIFGRANAAAFDENRLSYFTRESFDFLYPGYGSSYPSNMGSIGMLTEQGGGSRSARAVVAEDGYFLTLRQRIFDHYTTSMATIRTSAERRGALLLYFKRFFTQETNEGEAATYIFADDRGQGYAYDVVDMLIKHGIRIEHTDESVTIREANSYWDGTVSSRTFEGGAFVIRTDQPRHIFINTLFQRQMAIEDSVMYDMASWSVPLAYNLDAVWTRAQLSDGLNIVTEKPAAISGVINPGAQYAYVIDWKQRNAPRALARLWDEGYAVRSARKTFSDGSMTFSRGSLVILLGRNQKKLPTVADDMLRIASETGVQIVGMDTGRMAEGIDLSSRDSRFIKKPNVALLVDTPFSSYTAGQIWHLFDQWTAFGISRIRANELARIDLEEYDVLVMPGAGGGISRVMDSVQVERLRDWVQQGGTLVGTEGSALFLTGDRSKFTGVERVEEDENETEDEPQASYYTSYEARSDSSGLKRIPGSAFQGILDVTHPLAFGLPEHVYSLKLSTEAVEPSDVLQTVGYYGKDPENVLVSGYASSENKRKLAGKAFAAVQPMGSGRVIFLIDNTQYRMFWVGTARLMQNAIMLAPAM